MMQSTSIDRTLRATEIRYRRLFEAAQDGILLLNATTGQIEDVNPFLIRLLGYSYDEFLGKKLWEIGSFKDKALSKEAFGELQEKRYIRYENLPLETKDGRHISVEFVSNIYDCDGIDVIQCNIRDNTKRHLTEIALRAAARALQMLSEGNFALISSKTEAALLAEYCRIAVETGGYQRASVGVADNDPTRSIRIVSQLGRQGECIALGQNTWDDTALGQGPAGRALKSGQVQFSEDISLDDSMAPWRDEALRLGYRSTISVPFFLPDKDRACLSVYGASSDVWSKPERALLQEIAADLGFGMAAIRSAIIKTQHEERLRMSLESTIQVLADTADERDSYTGGHQRRVASICVRIATDMGLSPDRIHGLHLAASIHDLGKIGMPSELLSKPRSLSPIEFELIKEHARIGYNILKKVAFPWPIAQMVLQHHERMDGSGYPLGLKGDALLLESRILAVADVVEAMASHRPYRPALGIEAALDEIVRHRGELFDADVVDACLRVFREQGYVIVG